MPRLKQWHKVMQIFVIEYVEEKVTGKFLNEVIFESIKEIKSNQIHDFTIKTQKRAVRYNEHLFDKVIKNMARETLDGLLNFEAKRIIQNKQAKVINDPLEMICFEIITEVCRDESAKIVDETVNELSNEYKLLNLADNVYKNNIFTVTFTGLLTDMTNEILIETIFDDLIGVISESECREIANEILQQALELEEEHILDDCFAKFETRLLADVLSDDLVDQLMTINYEYLADIAIAKPNLIKQVSDDLINELRFNLD